MLCKDEGARRTNTKNKINNDLFIKQKALSDSLANANAGPWTDEYHNKSSRDETERPGSSTVTEEDEVLV